MAAQPVSFGEKLKALREARRAVRLVWESAPGLALANAGLAILISLLPLAGLLLLRQLLDQIATRAIDEFVLGTILFMAVVALCASVGRSLAGLISELQSLE